MVDTSVQHKAEAGVIEHGLPKLFPAILFAGRKLKLIWGGSFAFDAVSRDGAMVVAISTSAARTATGKLATAKFQKLKTDALYLLISKPMHAASWYSPKNRCANTLKSQLSPAAFHQQSNFCIFHFRSNCLVDSINMGFKLPILCAASKGAIKAPLD